ncbi:MAG: alanine dehydrogenase [Betaproteobacteria bacterium]|nr:alanine dehydrogenase [Betaproteobacteria bacterium]
MRIGIPKEIKDHEFRVGVTPAGVSRLRAEGHEIRVESGAGAKIGFSDDRYREAGATLCQTPEDVYEAGLIIKVKEPQPGEYPLLREGQTLFCYLHLAASADLTRALLERKIIGVAYETVTDAQGGTPLLHPMSEIAGRLSVQAGATTLEMAHGGHGTLLGGVPGVPPGRVAILGGGTVGANAAKIAIGLGADVTLLDVSATRLRYLDDIFGPRLKTSYSDPETIALAAQDADLLVGAVLIPGARAPKLLTRGIVQTMKHGSVLVDVSIDQGGLSETSRPTTHSQPTYVEEGVVHYCVTNMPAACARTSTLALTHVTLPYALRLAGQGAERALRADPWLRKGLNMYRGTLTAASVGADLGFDFRPPEEVLGP